MNERYLSRGKRVDNGEWVEGYLIQGNRTYIATIEAINHMVVSTSYMASIELVEVIPETVEQCSGVPDKNGTLMYEGDIVKGLFNFGLEIMSVCTFKDGAFGLTAKQCGAYHFSAFTSLWKVQYEVIGNIHDNPNLLKLEHDSLCETETYKAGDEE